MSYISPAKVKEIRNKIKAEFPTKKGWKFSITGKDYSSLNVNIMNAPVLFSEKGYEQLNHYYLDNYKNGDILKKINTICNETNYDKSDIMVDHYDVGFYFHLAVGKWDKDFELTK